MLSAKATELSDEISLVLQAGLRGGMQLGFVRYGDDRGSFTEELAKLRGPALLIVADVGRHDESFGPEGFDVRSLLLMRRQVSAVVLNEAEPEARHFLSAIERCLRHQEIVAIVETTERHLVDWKDFFDAKPGGPPVSLIVVAMVEKGRA